MYAHHLRQRWCGSVTRNRPQGKSIIRRAFCAPIMQGCINMSVNSSIWEPVGAITLLSTMHVRACFFATGRVARCWPCENTRETSRWWPAHNVPCSVWGSRRGGDRWQKKCAGSCIPKRMETRLRLSSVAYACADRGRNRRTHLKTVHANHQS